MVILFGILNVRPTRGIGAVEPTISHGSYGIIRSSVSSYDATHSSGTHPFGIKIDATPGRFN